MKLRRLFPASLLPLILLGISGCGGTPVEEQERFQSVMNKPADVAAADQWRSTVAGLRQAIISGEGDAMKYEMESIMEDTGTLNVMKLPEEHQATGSKIMDKMEELKSASESEAKALLKEMEELADSLPK